MSTSDIVKIALEFAGGLGLFLYGMKLMSENLEKAAGNKLKSLLSILTKNRFMAVIIGALFTMLIQSSSATTVMVVGFINAGLMSLTQSVGVIMGANIGTTITAQLVAFNLSKIAPAFLFIGVLLVFFANKKKITVVGASIAGFGMLFIGMSFMSSAMKPLQSLEGLQETVLKFENPVYGILAGAVFTAVIQSSSASVGIMQAMASQGLIGLHGSVYIVLGQNIGTCITAILACIRTTKNAKRAALIHLMFNVVGAIVFSVLLSFIPIADWIIKLSPNNAMRQIANFHVLFNISMTLLLFPFGNLLVAASRKMVKGEETEEEPQKLLFIDERLFNMPGIAQMQIQKEIMRMARLTRENITDAVAAFTTGDDSLISGVYKKEQVIDYLNHEITRYLVKANQSDITEEDKIVIGSFFHVVTDLERIGDHAENIVEFAETRIDGSMVFSAEAIEELQMISQRVFELLDISCAILERRDRKTAKATVAPLEQRIDDMEKNLKQKHIDRLNSNLCAPRAGTIFIEILSNLERVADHATNIAYSVLQDA